MIQPHELKRLSSLGSLTEDNEKDPKVLRWKLFNRYYGYKDGVRVSFDFSTWPELPVEFGFLDLHFVELCIDSPTLYNTGKSIRLTSLSSPSLQLLLPDRIITLTVLLFFRSLV